MRKTFIHIDVELYTIYLLYIYKTHTRWGSRPMFRGFIMYSYFSIYDGV